MQNDKQEIMTEEQNMSFWDHLEALRWSLMRVAIVMTILLVGLFSYMPTIFDKFVLAPTTSEFFLYRWLSKLGHLGPFFPNFGNDNYAVEIININVASQFMTHITTAFWFAFILSFPYLIYELWKFIKPALYKNEEKYIGFAFLFGTSMFYIGCALGYTLVFPFTFRFLTEYDNMLFIASTNNKFIKAKRAIYSHNVNQDRDPTNLNHRLWLKLAFFRNSGTESTC